MNILFIGNSITYVVPDPERQYNWHGGCGMAASSVGKDYVHLTVAALRERFGDVSFILRNVADFERNFAMFDMEQYRDLREFGADVIVMRIIENVNHALLVCDDFGCHYKRLIDYLNADRHAAVITSGNFWPDVAGDAIIRAVAEKQHYPYVSFECMQGEDANDYRAIGLYTHEGIANHPGDKGMLVIASLITEAITGALS